LPADHELPKNDESVKTQPPAAELEHTNEELTHEDAEKIADGNPYGEGTKIVSTLTGSSAQARVRHRHRRPGRNFCPR
jgi:hypothetical protein